MRQGGQELKSIPQCSGSEIGGHCLFEIAAGITVGILRNVSSTQTAVLIITAIFF